MFRLRHRVSACPSHCSTCTAAGSVVACSECHTGYGLAGDKLSCPGQYIINSDIILLTITWLNVFIKHSITVIWH